MKKPILQKTLILSGLTVLLASPFLVYFGTKFYVYDLHGCGKDKAVWSFCGINEVQAGVTIGFALLLIASAFFVIATLKKK
jgi:hypothetical protein